LDPVNTQLNIVRDQTDGTEGSYQSKVLRMVKKSNRGIDHEKKFITTGMFSYFIFLLPYASKIILFLVAFFIVLQMCLGEMK